MLPKHEPPQRGRHWKHWTKEEERILREKGAHECSKITGRTLEGCQTHARVVLGLKGKGRRWKAHEEELLLSRGPEACAQHTGRTLSACKDRLRALKKKRAR